MGERWGKKIIYLLLRCHHQTDSCINIELPEGQLGMTQHNEDNMASKHMSTTL